MRDILIFEMGPEHFPFRSVFHATGGHVHTNFPVGPNFDVHRDVRGKEVQFFMIAGLVTVEM